MERQIEFIPADSPTGLMYIWFVLKGERGAVHFSLSTDWMWPEEMKKRQAGRGRNDRSWFYPIGFAMGYHSPVPSEDESCPQDCPYLGGRPCYYTQSFLQADAMLDILLSTGTAGVWPALEEKYRERFGELV